MGLTAAEEEPIRPGRRLGRYVLHHRIARGGMGAVYLATTEGIAGFERWFAVKLMHPHLSDAPNLVKRFYDEARVASRIQHPNVCAVFDFGQEADGLLYLVMEYLHGAPLVDLARGGTPVPVWLALRTIADAARGLEAAHRLVDDHGEPLGLVHRDVSPQNLVVLYEGPTKVLDFGVVRVRDQIATTQEGSMRGKLGYMSPEQIESKPLDARSDIFALGVVLWELLVGRRLFKRDNAIDTMKAVLFDAPPAPSTLRPDLDARVDALVMRALRPEPALRYPSAAAFADAIEETLAALGERSDHARVAAAVSERLATQRAEREAVLGALEAGETVTLPYQAEDTSASDPPSLSHVRDREPPRRWLLPAVAVACLALGIGGTVLATRLSGAAEPAAPAPGAPVTTAGTAAASSTDEAAPERASEGASGADEEVSAADGAGGDAVPDPAPEPPARDERRSGAAARRLRGPARSTRAATAATSQPVGEGRLNLIALPEAEVFLQGRRLGRTPLVGLSLPAGSHRLSLRAADGRRETVVARIRAGETTALSHRFEAR